MAQEQGRADFSALAVTRIRDRQDLAHLHVGTQDDCPASPNNALPSLQPLVNEFAATRCSLRLVGCHPAVYGQEPIGGIHIGTRRSRRWQAGRVETRNHISRTLAALRHICP